jgi:ABC-type transport system involved in multi-copper enzyme maturation permease subunit
MLRRLAGLYVPFLDPVFLKDLGGLSRRWRLYAGRMIYISLIGGLVYLILGTLKGPIGPSASAALGRGIFVGIVTIQMGYATLAMSHLAADLLLREARSGTLQLMLLTPLSGWRIALGKWKASMAHAASLILAGLPPLGITAYLGGVTWWELVWSSSLTFALAGLSSALALFAALNSRTAVRAAFLANGLLLLWGLILLILFGIAYAFFHSPWIIFAAECLHPVAAAIGAENAAWFGSPAAYGWIGATALSLMAAQVFLMSAAGHLSISESVDELLASKATLPSDFVEVRSSICRTVWERHPLLWRESATFETSGWGWTRRLALVILCSVLVFIVVRGDEKAMKLGVWLLPLTGLAMAAGAGLFTQDKEGRHLEILLTMPVSSGQIIGAKLLSRVWTVEGAAYVLSILFMLEVWFDRPPGPCLPLVPLVLCFALFAYILAALASLNLQTYRSAFLLAGAVVWGVLLGLPLLREVLPGPVLWIAHPTALTQGLMDGDVRMGSSIGTFVLVYGALTALMIGVMIRQYRGQVR